MHAGYELVDHTADIGVHAWGLTPADVFEQAAQALFSLVCDPREIAEKESLEVTIEADAPDLLLAAWLNELLYIFETRSLVLSQFQILEIGERSLHAKLIGELLDPRRHTMCGGVKAATLHELFLKPREGGWEGFVIFDV